jgi:hypothetical protein
MEPLITGGVEPAHLRGAEKRSGERDWLPRRKRPVTTRNSEEDQEPGLEAPKHALDDLA